LWSTKRDQELLAGRVAMASANVLKRTYSLSPIQLPTSGHNPSVNPGLIETKDGYLVIARSSRLRCYDDVDYIENKEKVDDINYLYRLDSNLQVISSQPLDEQLLRMEGHSIRHCMSDTRLFFWKNQLWAIGAAARIKEKQEVISQILFRIENNAVVEAIPLDSPIGSALEKNWTPVIKQGDLKLIYSFTPLNVINITEGKAAIDGIFKRIKFHDARGGTPLIEYKGGFIGLVHQEPNMWNGRRSYTHSFAWFSKDLELLEISEPFYLQRKGLEFAAGICNVKDGILVSYGVADRACMLMHIPDEVISDYLVI
jgi:hypothetical protein